MVVVYLLAAIGFITLLAFGLLAFGVVFIGRLPEDAHDLNEAERRWQRMERGLAREKHP